MTVLFPLPMIISHLHCCSIQFYRKGYSQITLASLKSVLISNSWKARKTASRNAITNTVNLIIPAKKGKDGEVRLISHPNHWCEMVLDSKHVCLNIYSKYIWLTSSPNHLCDSPEYFTNSRQPVISNKSVGVCMCTSVTVFYSQWFISACLYRVV